LYVPIREEGLDERGKIVAHYLYFSPLTIAAPKNYEYFSFSFFKNKNKNKNQIHR
jgi:hypothetical protein